MSEQTWGPGFLLDGKYQLAAKLGEGGMGSVWRADHLTLNAPVAVKVLDASIANSEEGQARFLREAQAAAALRSAHVVQTFDYGISQGVPYIVMELMVGDTLSERLSAKGPMAPTVVARLLRQVARAVGKAHQAGIVHRDLKPDNIFLVEGDDDDFTAKVLDFGIAKATAGVGGALTGSKTRTGALLGTPYYMSPEQAQGTKVIDFRTDLWALAVIVYECLAGKRPFDSEALGDLLLKICAAPAPVPSQEGVVLPGFDAWFAKATQRDPAARFQTAAEMAKSFTALLEPDGARMSDSSMSSFGPVSTLGPSGDSLEGSEVTPARFAKQNRTRVMIGAAAGVAALLGLAIILGRSGSKTDTPPQTPAVQAPVNATPPAPEPSPTPPPAAPPKEEPTEQPSASTAPSTASHAKSASGSKAAKAAANKTPASGAAAAPAAAQPKKQETFDPLMMRR